MNYNVLEFCLERSKNQFEPEVLLWKYVLVQLYKDFGRKRGRKQLTAYLETKDFELVCDYSNVNHNEIKTILGDNK